MNPLVNREDKDDFLALPIFRYGLTCPFSRPIEGRIDVIASPPFDGEPVKPIGPRIRTGVKVKIKFFLETFQEIRRGEPIVLAILGAVIGHGSPHGGRE